MSADERVATAMKEIFDEIPSHLNIVGFMNKAHRKLVEAALPDLPGQFVTEKLVEVLREIAAYSVEQFERRTGQRFLWTEPEEEVVPDDTIMSFALDEKGNVVF